MREKRIEDELLDKTLNYNYSKELDKLHDHIAQLRLLAVSYSNITKNYEQEIEKLNNIIGKAIGLIYDYQMNDEDNVNYKELLYILQRNNK